MARLYSNENFPMPVVDALRFAIEQGRAVLTLNRRHFVKLHQMVPDHQGIVVCTFDPDFSRQAQAIHAAITRVPTLAGQLIRINRPPA